MKRLIPVLLLCLAFQGQAQILRRLEESFLKPGFFHLEVAYALPVMDFGLAQFSPSSGYAEPGFQISGGVGYEIMPSLGLSLGYVYNQNPFNDKQLTTDYFPYRNSLLSGTTLEFIATQPWVIRGLMGGILYPIRNFNTTYEVSIEAGYLGSVMGQQDFHLGIDSFPGQSIIMRIEEASANGMAYRAGMHIRHRISKDLLLFGQANFFYSEQEYRNLIVKIVGTNLAAQWSDAYTQYFHVLSFGLGLAWQFE